MNKFLFKFRFPSIYWVLGTDPTGLQVLILLLGPTHESDKDVAQIFFNSHFFPISNFIKPALDPSCKLKECDLQIREWVSVNLQISLTDWGWHSCAEVSQGTYHTRQPGGPHDQSEPIIPPTHIYHGFHWIFIYPNWLDHWIKIKQKPYILTLLNLRTTEQGVRMMGLTRNFI